MGIRNPPREFDQPRSVSQIADFRLAASKMTGSTRRAFQAEMTLQSCQGNPLQAEIVFGWGRRTVALGLAEKRTGIICPGAQSACNGRKRWEDKPPEVAAGLRQLAEAHAPHDPPLRPPRASTRLTAHAALEALGAQGDDQEHVPAPSPMAAVLNRLGFRWRTVLKATSQKKIAETDAIFATMANKTRTWRHRTRSNA